MSKFTRAIGFLAGGAAQGYGLGIVEQAKLNWTKMLQEESEARADAREMRRMTHDTLEKAADRTLRKDELAGAREDRTLAREETKAFREQSRQDTLSYRADLERDRDQRRRLEQERIDLAKDGGNTKSGLSADAERLLQRLESRILGPDDIEPTTAAERMSPNYRPRPNARGLVKMRSWLKDDPELLKLYESPTDLPLEPRISHDSARPRKPAEHPDARWSDRAKAWVVQKDGKWYAVE